MPEIQGTLVVVDATGVVIRCATGHRAAEFAPSVPSGMTAYDVTADPSAVDPTWVDSGQPEKGIPPQPAWFADGRMKYDGTTLSASTQQERDDTEVAIAAIEEADRKAATKEQLKNSDANKRLVSALIDIAMDVGQRIRDRDAPRNKSAYVAYFRNAIDAEV